MAPAEIFDVADRVWQQQSAPDQALRLTAAAQAAPGFG